jgi:hypothetical protein
MRIRKERKGVLSHSWKKIPIKVKNAKIILSSRVNGTGTYQARVRDDVLHRNQQEKGRPPL